MAWKWYDITSYKASVGGTQGDYYGGVQLFGDGFYASLKFREGNTLPDSTAPTRFGQRFYGFMRFEQMAAVIDLLRNEEPVRFGWYEQNPNLFHLMTGSEPVGEGDGELSADSDD